MADDVKGTVPGLVRALGSVLGVHIQYAQREARTDMGRVISGVVLLGIAALFVMLAVLFGHVALAYYLSLATKLDALGAVAVVGAGDLGIAVLLVLIGRARLKKPVLEQTRTLVKRTVESFADV